MPRFTYERSKCLKKLRPWLSAKLLFMSLLTAPIINKSHVLTGIYFNFLKNVPGQTFQTFNTKFGCLWKDQKSSYQVGQILATFCKLVALTQKCFKDFSVKKIAK